MHPRFRTPFLIGLVAFAAILAAFVATSGFARSAYAQEPPPRPTAAPPTAAPTSQPKERERDKPAPAAPSGRITGTVIDAATSAPTSSVRVRVGESVVVTDGNGNYDLPGLPAGAYVVALVLGDGATPAQEPVTVQLSDGQTVVRHLAFRPAAPAVTLAPASQPEMPTVLPATSGERSSTLVTRAVVGVLLLAMGIMGRLLLRRRAM